MSDRLLLSAAEVQRILSVGRDVFRSIRNDPDFPRTVRVPGFRRDRWRRSDVESWVNSLPNSVKRPESDDSSPESDDQEQIPEGDGGDS